MEKMMQKMMKRYPVFIAMGFMIVVLSVVVGATNTAAAASYYAVDKATRETSAGWAQVQAGIESTLIWLPYFKFLGIAMIVSGITMALGVIATRLQDMGAAVVGSSGVAVPPRPRSVVFMRLFMMLGWMVLLAGLILALWLNGTVAAYWANVIATDLNPAVPGSMLLAQLGLISTVLPWLGSLRFLGMALLFTAITVALTVILRTLQAQETSLRNFVQARAAKQ